MENLRRWAVGIAALILVSAGCDNGGAADAGDTGAETTDTASDAADSGGGMDSSPDPDSGTPTDVADSGTVDSGEDTSPTDAADTGGGSDVADGGPGDTTGGSDVPRRDTTGDTAGSRFQVVSCTNVTPAANVQVGPLYVFSPQEVTIAPGEVVQWSWASDVNLQHNVTADDNQACATARPSWFQSSTTAAGGATFCVRFGATGTWRYQCTIRNHCSLGMKGRVVVQ